MSRSETPHGEGHPPLLELRGGRIAGRHESTRYGAVDAFLGVRYARAERFRPPQPRETRDEPSYDATRFGPAAPQAIRVGSEMRTSEADCLNLNIWRPSNGRQQLPIMVWIHGGGFRNGSNAQSGTDGARLAARHNVVVVGLNYRLGVLGFIALEHLLGSDYHDSGNLALLDLIHGLRWVRENAEQLGGDRDRVTIFGQSAGGAAVATLLGVRSTKGLFSGAIVQSGTAERARSLDEAVRCTAELLTVLELSEADSRRLLTLPVDDLIAAQEILARRHGAKRVVYSALFQPTIGDLLPDLPYRGVAAGVHSTTDLLIGTNLNEGTDAVDLTWDDETVRRLPQGLDEMIADDFDTSGPTAASYTTVLTRELGRAPRAAELIEAYRTDSMQRQPSQRLIEARRGTPARTYSYLFAWSNPFDQGRGSAHSLEIPFIFDRLDEPRLAASLGSCPPQSLADTISTRWAAFAHRTPPDDPNGLSWPEYWPDRETMVFDEDVSVVQDPRGEIRRLLE